MGDSLQPFSHVTFGDEAVIPLLQKRNLFLAQGSSTHLAISITDLSYRMVGDGLLSKSVTFYLIRVRCGLRSWTVEHRYSSFVNLDKELRAAVPNVTNFPPLPKGDFVPDLEQRRKGLQTYLRSVARIKACWKTGILINFLDDAKKTLALEAEFARVFRATEVLSQAMFLQHKKNISLIEELSVATDQLELLNEKLHVIADQLIVDPAIRKKAMEILNSEEPGVSSYEPGGMDYDAIFDDDKESQIFVNDNLVRGSVVPGGGPTLDMMLNNLKLEDLDDSLIVRNIMKKAAEKGDALLSALSLGRSVSDASGTGVDSPRSHVSSSSHTEKAFPQISDTDQSNPDKSPKTTEDSSLYSSVITKDSHHSVTPFTPAPLLTSLTPSFMTSTSTFDDSTVITGSSFEFGTSFSPAFSSAVDGTNIGLVGYSESLLYASNAVPLAHEDSGSEDEVLSIAPSVLRYKSSVRCSRDRSGSTDSHSTSIASEVPSLSGFTHTSAASLQLLVSLLQSPRGSRRRQSTLHSTFSSSFATPKSLVNPIQSTAPSQPIASDHTDSPQASRNNTSGIESRDSSDSEEGDEFDAEASDLRLQFFSPQRARARVPGAPGAVDFRVSPGSPYAPRSLLSSESKGPQGQSNINSSSELGLPKPQGRLFLNPTRVRSYSADDVRSLRRLVDLLVSEPSTSKSNASKAPIDGVVFVPPARTMAVMHSLRAFDCRGLASGSQVRRSMLALASSSSDLRENELQSSYSNRNILADIVTSPPTISTNVSSGSSGGTPPLLATLMPTAAALSKRREVIFFIASLIRREVGLEVFPVGASASHCVLPSSPIELALIVQPTKALAGEPTSTSASSRSTQSSSKMKVPSSFPTAQGAFKDLAMEGPPSPLIQVLHVLCDSAYTSEGPSHPPGSNQSTGNTDSSTSSPAENLNSSVDGSITSYPLITQIYALSKLVSDPESLANVASTLNFLVLGVNAIRSVVDVSTEDPPSDFPLNEALDIVRILTLSDTFSSVGESNSSLDHAAVSKRLQHVLNRLSSKNESTSLTSPASTPLDTPSCASSCPLFSAVTKEPTPAFAIRTVPSQEEISVARAALQLATHLLSLSHTADHRNLGVFCDSAYGAAALRAAAGGFLGQFLVVPSPQSAAETAASQRRISAQTEGPEVIHTIPPLTDTYINLSATAASIYTHFGGARGGPALTCSCTPTESLLALIDREGGGIPGLLCANCGLRDDQSSAEAPVEGKTNEAAALAPFSSVHSQGSRFAIRHIRFSVVPQWAGSEELPEEAYFSASSSENKLSDSMSDLSGSLNKLNFPIQVRNGIQVVTCLVDNIEVSVFCSEELDYRPSPLQNLRKGSSRKTSVASERKMTNSSTVEVPSDNSPMRTERESASTMKSVSVSEIRGKLASKPSTLTLPTLDKASSAADKASLPAKPTTGVPDLTASVESEDSFVSAKSSFCLTNETAILADAQATQSKKSSSISTAKIPPSQPQKDYVLSTGLAGSPAATVIATALLEDVVLAVDAANSSARFRNCVSTSKTAPEAGLALLVPLHSLEDADLCGPDTGVYVGSAVKKGTLSSLLSLNDAVLLPSHSVPADLFVNGSAIPAAAPEERALIDESSYVWLPRSQIFKTSLLLISAWMSYEGPAFAAAIVRRFTQSAPSDAAPAGTNRKSLSSGLSHSKNSLSDFDVSGGIPPLFSDSVLPGFTSLVPPVQSSSQEEGSSFKSGDSAATSEQFQNMDWSHINRFEPLLNRGMLEAMLLALFLAAEQFAEEVRSRGASPFVCSAPRKKAMNCDFCSYSVRLTKAFRDASSQQDSDARATGSPRYKPLYSCRDCAWKQYLPLSGCFSSPVEVALAFSGVYSSLDFERFVIVPAPLTLASRILSGIVPLSIYLEALNSEYAQQLRETVTGVAQDAQLFHASILSGGSLTDPRKHSDASETASSFACPGNIFQRFGFGMSPLFHTSTVDSHSNHKKSSPVKGLWSHLAVQEYLPLSRCLFYHRNKYLPRFLKVNGVGSLLSSTASSGCKSPSDEGIGKLRRSFWHAPIVPQERASYHVSTCSKSGYLSSPPPNSSSNQLSQAVPTIRVHLTAMHAPHVNIAAGISAFGACVLREYMRTMLSVFSKGILEALDAPVAATPVSQQPSSACHPLESVLDRLDLGIVMPTFSERFGDGSRSDLLVHPLQALRSVATRPHPSVKSPAQVTSIRKRIVAGLVRAPREFRFDKSSLLTSTPPSLSSTPSIDPSLQMSASLGQKSTPLSLKHRNVITLNHEDDVFPYSSAVIAAASAGTDRATSLTSLGAFVGADVLVSTGCEQRSKVSSAGPAVVSGNPHIPLSCGLDSSNTLELASFLAKSALPHTLQPISCPGVTKAPADLFESPLVDGYFLRRRGLVFANSGPVLVVGAREPSGSLLIPLPQGVTPVRISSSAAAALHVPSLPLSLATTLAEALCTHLWTPASLAALITSIVGWKNGLQVSALGKFVQAPLVAGAPQLLKAFFAGLKGFCIGFMGALAVVRHRDNFNPFVGLRESDTWPLLPHVTFLAVLAGDTTLVGAPGASSRQICHLSEPHAVCLPKKTTKAPSSASNKTRLVFGKWFHLPISAMGALVRTAYSSPQLPLFHHHFAYQHSHQCPASVSVSPLLKSPSPPSFCAFFSANLHFHDVLTPVFPNESHIQALEKDTAIVQRLLEQQIAVVLGSGNESSEVIPARLSTQNLLSLLSYATVLLPADVCERLERAIFETMRGGGPSTAADADPDAGNNTSKGSDAMLTEKPAITGPSSSLVPSPFNDTQLPPRGTGSITNKAPVQVSVSVPPGLNAPGGMKLVPVPTPTAGKVPLLSPQAAVPLPRPSADFSPPVHKKQHSILVDQRNISSQMNLEATHRGPIASPPLNPNLSNNMKMHVPNGYVQMPLGVPYQIGAPMHMNLQLQMQMQMQMQQNMYATQYMYHHHLQQQQQQGHLYYQMQQQHNGYYGAPKGDNRDTADN